MCLIKYQCKEDKLKIRTSMDLCSNSADYKYRLISDDTFFC